MSKSSELTTGLVDRVVSAGGEFFRYVVSGFVFLVLFAASYPSTRPRIWWLLERPGSLILVVLLAGASVYALHRLAWEIVDKLRYPDDRKAGEDLEFEFGKASEGLRSYFIFKHGCAHFTLICGELFILFGSPWFHESASFVDRHACQFVVFGLVVLGISGWNYTYQGSLRDHGLNAERQRQKATPSREGG